MTPAWASILSTRLAHYEGSWRTVFVVVGSAGLLPLSLILPLVFDRPEQYRDISHDELEYAYRDEIAAGTLRRGDYVGARESLTNAPGAALAQLIRNRTYLAVVFIDIAMQIVLYGALIWVPLYLSDTFGFHLITMGSWSSLYFMAGAVGSLVSAYFSDRVFSGNRKVMIMVLLPWPDPFPRLARLLASRGPNTTCPCALRNGLFGEYGLGAVHGASCRHLFA